MTDKRPEIRGHSVHAVEDNDMPHGGGGRKRSLPKGLTSGKVSPHEKTANSRPEGLGVNLQDLRHAGMGEIIALVRRWFEMFATSKCSVGKTKPRHKSAGGPATHAVPANK